MSAAKAKAKTRQPMEISAAGNPSKSDLESCVTGGGMGCDPGNPPGTSGYGAWISVDCTSRVLDTANLTLSEALLLVMLLKNKMKPTFRICRSINPDFYL